MFRALWFLLRLSLLVVAVVFVAKNPGTLRIDNWMGYEIEADMRFVLAFLVAFLLVWTFAYRLYRAVVTVPAALRKYRAAAMREKGYLALTRGMVAVAAGDAHSADKYARRAARMIPGAPLARLLTAQSSLLAGNTPRARAEFQALLADDAAAIFGIRGLLNETLEAGNYSDALTYIRQAEKIQPKRSWVIRTLFDLETKNRDFTNALRTLKRAEKYGVFDARRVKSHRAALFMALSYDSAGDAEKAYRYADAAFGLNPAFVPAADALARYYIGRDKRRAAIKIVQKAWEAGPHPDLAALWMSLAPQPKKKASLYDQGRDLYNWAQQLHDLRPDHRDSMRLLGHAALEARMMREARELLQRAFDYRALARLERMDNGNEAKAREWLEMSADAPADPQWVCGTCGHMAGRWQPVCSHCHTFNSQEWMIPAADARILPAQTPASAADLLIAPASAMK